MDYLPVSINLKNRRCLVVGGGNIAIRKSRQLLNAGAKVAVVSPEFHPDFLVQQSEGLISLVHSEYHVEQLQGTLLVIAATDRIEINKQVHDDAESAGILVNVVDQPGLCRFIVPSIVDRTPLTIAISTGGSGPVFARMLREKLEWLIPDNIGDFLTRVNNDRAKVAEKFPEMSERRDFWERFFERELGWSTSKNLSQSNKKSLNLDYQLFQTVQPNNDSHDQATHSEQLALIDFGRGQIDDLSVSIITQLQKVDNLYVSQSNYQLLKDLIRRDADIHILDHTLCDYSDASCLLEDIVENIELSKQQGRSVVINDGHLFQQLDKKLSSLILNKNQINYTRIAIAKYD
ncbi:MAG: bifunctional precorrin-2 dehydrogenase/sirohydrochlorin ferrochelatase [Kangiellaceae bacterium]